MEEAGQDAVGSEASAASLPRCFGGCLRSGHAVKGLNESTHLGCMVKGSEPNDLLG